jgi:hypothetical protein
MGTLIAVLAEDHPEPDDWVLELASAEAERDGIALPPYQGIAVTSDGSPVHLYGDPEAASKARAYWSEH